MLTFIVRRIAYSIPVLLIASLLVFVFVHATTDPLARYSQSRDLTLKAREGLGQGIYEQPCQQLHRRISHRCRPRRARRRRCSSSTGSG